MPMNLWSKTRGIRICAIQVVVLMLLCACVIAQDSSSQDTPSSQNESDTAPMTGLKSVFGEGFAGRWRLTGDASVNQAYDDNVFSSNTDHLGDSVDEVALRLSAGIKKKRLTFQAHYLPQYSLHAKYSERNAFTQQYLQDLSYRLTNRTTFEWAASANRIETTSTPPTLLVDFNGLFVPLV